MKPPPPLHSGSSLYRVILETRKLFHVLAQASSELSADTGITASMRAVMEELFPVAQLTVPEIARRKNVTRQHIQQIVNQLQDSGLVALADNPSHKRSPLIHLTSKGVTSFKQIAAREQALLTALEEEFTDLPLDETAKTLNEIRTYFSSPAWQEKVKVLK